MKDKTREKADLLDELVRLRQCVGNLEKSEKERKQTEEAFKESEQVLHSIVSGSPIPAFVIGKDHLIIFWNKALEELSRIPAREVIGTSQQWRAFYASERPCMADLMVDEALEKIPQWYADKYIKSNLLDEAYEAIDYFPELGAQGRWLRFTAAVIRNAQGHLVGAIETLEDITAKKLAENELLKAREDLEARVKERTLALAKANESLQAELIERRRAEQALKQTTDHLSLILESLPMVSYTRNAQGAGRITFVSSTIREITGYTPDRFLEESTFWEDHIHPDDRRRVISSLKSGTKKGFHRYEYRFRVSNDSYKWFSDYWRVTQFSGDPGKHIVGAWQDVSEEKRIRQEAEIKLQQMMHAHKLTALGEVVAGVAHEINNPISFISYNIPLLEEIWKSVALTLADKTTIYPQWKSRGMTLDELNQNMNEIIHAFKIASNRITRVINNLKEFSRSDESSQKKLVMISDVLQGALLIVGAQVQRTVSSITQNMEHHLPPIRGHFQKLEQVFTNLLINAHQAMPPGRKGKITITARYIERIHSVLVEIEDNGKGMSHDVLDHIFDPFYTTRRNTGGTGLGLSISYGLIKEHRGTFAVLSRPGQGSRFTVFLPIEAKGPPKLSSSMLFIDNNIVFIKELKACFVDGDSWPATSPYAPDAVVSYLERHPEVDVVISEIKLPGGNGLDIMKRIQHRFPLLTVILYSADPAVLDDAARDPVKADYIFKKPFSMEELQSTINGIGRQRICES